MKSLAIFTLGLFAQCCFLSAQNHHITRIPAESIVNVTSCESTIPMWTSKKIGDLQVGEEVMAVAWVKNVDTGKETIIFGGIGFHKGEVTYATVGEIKRGIIDGGDTTLKRVTSKAQSGTLYSTSIVSGEYGVYKNFNPEDCDFMNIKSSLVGKEPEELKCSDGLWWAVSSAGNGPCFRYCCTIGNACDCDGWVAGCPDIFHSMEYVVADQDSEWVSIRIKPPPGWFRQQAIQGLGYGTILYRIGIPIQGDRWTDRVSPEVDQVGHVVITDTYIKKIVG